MNVLSSSAGGDSAGDQLGALRRVAELIARGAERTAVLNAVVAETYTLFPVEFTAMLRYDVDGAASIVAVHHGPPGLAVGERAPYIPEGLVLRVFGSGRPARVEAYDDLPSPGVARMQELGISAGAAAPILVDGRIWGVLAAMTRSGPVVPGLEHRLAEFAEVAATAVAGAQATYERQGLTDEQGALRRVAELAASGADPHDVLKKLTSEMAALLPGKTVAVVRFEADGAATVDAVSEGTTFARDDLAAWVRNPGRTPHHDESAGVAPSAGGPVVVAVPIHVEGTIWGMLAAASLDDSLSDDTKGRLSPFAEIAAVAIAGAKARVELRRIAQEQAALRRVAEAVARGSAEQQLFDAVTEEVSTLIGRAATTLARFTGRRTFVVVAAASGNPAVIGLTVEVPEDDRGLVAEILRTRLPVRLDDFADRPGPQYAQAGLVAGPGVAVPITVQERMWGMLGVTTTGHRLPADTERRLGQFAELVATAVAKSEAWARVEQLARHQSALRQIAELAARDAPGAQVLEAVTAQAANLTGVQFTAVLRYDPDGSAEIMALSGAPADLRPGMRAPAGDGATGRVWRTNRTARIDDLDGVGSRWAEIARAAGFATGNAVPIRMHSRLWGTLIAVGRTEPLSAAVEEDLTSFAELASTAISATQARNDLRALADEQAALRRVAELVAIGTALDDVFQAVSDEAARLLNSSYATLQRFENDGASITVATYDAGPEATDARPEAAPRADRELTVPVVVEGRVWGALTATTTGGSPPESTQERLRQFAGLAAAAIATAENKARLTASRARVVATADEARRRLQRDVHDGAQQRLVQTIITLKIARDALARGGSPGPEVSEALYHAERANAELRDLVHGILPAALAQGGLRAGLDSLIGDLDIPVDLQLTAPRLPAQIEITIYFFVAEALTNVVKHARAGHAEVMVRMDGATLLAEVRDDGIGGADPSSGSGLTGLSDRIQAAEGTLTLTSPTGGGTAVRVTLPLPETNP